MANRCVQIVTKDGTAPAMFETGLLQGSNLSVQLANPVTAMKFDAWRSPDPKNDHPYELQAYDPSDEGNQFVWALGYCDDNSRYMLVPTGNLMDALHLAQESIDITGDLSLVTKLGRKGSKTSAAIYNVDPTQLLQHASQCSLSSIAWSYKHMAPIKETVELRIHLKPNTTVDMKALRQSTNSTLPDGTSIEETLNSLDVLDLQPHNHLGITSTLEGDTSAMAKKYILKGINTVHDLAIYKFKGLALRYAVNSLLNTVASYAPLLCGMTLEQVAHMDNKVNETLKRQVGLTKTDASEILYVSDQRCGLGFTSFTNNYISSIGRELEVVLNSKTPAGVAVRSRIMQGEKHDPDSPIIHNYAQRCTNLLASLGIFI